MPEERSTHRPPTSAPGSQPDDALALPKPSPVVDYASHKPTRTVSCSVCRELVHKTRIMAGRHMCLNCIAEFYGGEEE